MIEKNIELIEKLFERIEVIGKPGKLIVNIRGIIEIPLIKGK